MKSVFRLVTLLALCSTLALATACKQSGEQKSSAPAAASPGGGAQATHFIPSDVDFALRADVAGVAKQVSPEKRAEAREKILEALKQQDNEVLGLFQALNVDIFNDVQALAVGASIDPLNPDKGDMILAFQSTLTSDKVANALKAEAAEELTIESFSQDGAKGYKIAPKQNADAEGITYMVDSDGILLLATAPAMISKALGAKKAGQSAFVSGAVAEGLKQVDPASQVAFLLNAKKLPKDPQTLGAMPGADDMQTVFGTYKYANTRHDLAVSFRFGQPSNAQTLTNQLQGLMGMFAMDPNMKAVLENFKLTVEGTDMRLAVSLTDAQIEEIERSMQQTMTQ